jgi:phage shock protein E
MIDRFGTLLAAVIAACLLAVVPAAAADTPTVTPRELLSAMKKKDQKILVLDVRSDAEYEGGHVPGAVHIPHDQLADRLAEIRAHEPDRIVVYCESGFRAAKAERALEEAGLPGVEHLEGDMKGWRALDLPTRRPLSSVEQPGSSKQRHGSPGAH